MPTDYACQAAAERAARGITPVRDILVPFRPQQQQEDVPVVLRSYLGVQSNGGPNGGGPAAHPPVSTNMGAAVLLVFLDGLRSEMSGVLSEWYADLAVRLPQTLGAPAAGGQAPARQPGGWQTMADLQNSAQEVLTDLSGRARGGPGALNVRLALVEDTLSGALRRMNVPADVAIGSAGELVVSAGSLFGLQTRPAPPIQAPAQQSYDRR
ncbi:MULTISPECIES: hypothetical protein [Streptomyces]|uniref:hypothetical protein n=1 Tax=Streptomyces TaxID=1883 RepID=UPI000F7859BC|nr:MULTISPECIES: hypothetical protein [Streptomyces]MZE75945.1 hypothetical protein [Streptomyces sp. SID5475]MCC3650521.1 hypothetical protein [Streptomyces sp. S07_1.15]MCC5036616.1 hypothetical protein [Streptomyces sp. WAC 00631]MCC9738239.1 hypothetical protein [Streptomyces sp. MNU89]WSQ74506.1 hypothetical protein OG463_25975 [Streptomyces xinghaiensis]